jgi:hypothetical protein
MEIDTPLEYAFVAACLLGGVAGLAAWVHGIGEMIGMQSLFPPSFARGPRLLRFARDLEQPAGALPATAVDTATGRFRFIAPDECLFAPRARWYLLFLQTPLALKGRARLAGSRAEIEARAPLGPLLFLAAIAPGFALAATIDPSFASVFPAVAVALAVSLAFERWRARRIVSEIAAHLSAMRRTVRPD